MQYLKKYRGLFLLGIIVIFLTSYLHVSGSEIALISDISDSCTVTVAKYEILKYEDRVEYILDSRQIGQLKAFLLESDYTRNFAVTVYSEQKDMYDITVDFNDGQRFLSIHCFAGEYISIPDQFGGKHLKIRNSDWKDILEAILAQ